MRARENFGTISDKRLLTITEGTIYTGIGRSSFRKWADEIGATVKFGSRVLFDKTIIDQKLDKISGMKIKETEMVN